jgi:hypothetical protein
MCERELADPQLHRLAKAIYTEIRKQLDGDGPAAPVVSAEAGMRNVIVTGHIDLVKVAAALSKRCCLQLSDIETIAPSAEKTARSSKDTRHRCEASPRRSAAV